MHPGHPQQCSFDAAALPHKTMNGNAISESWLIPTLPDNDLPAQGSSLGPSQCHLQSLQHTEVCLDAAAASVCLLPVETSLAASNQTCSAGKVP